MRISFLVAALALVASAVWASGNRVVTWKQLADCEGTGGYELGYEPALLAGSTPSTAAVLQSVPKPATLTCGTATSATVMLVGAGQARFWIRAVTTDGVWRSAWSNWVEGTIPFAEGTVLIGVQ